MSTPLKSLPSVLWSSSARVDVANTINHARCRLAARPASPFWKSKAPLSFIGWGKTTQLGYGLGLASGTPSSRACRTSYVHQRSVGPMPCHTASPGMDFETAVRTERSLPILSILLNNSAMAVEQHRECRFASYRALPGPQTSRATTRNSPAAAGRVTAAG